MSETAQVEALVVKDLLSAVRGAERHGSGIRWRKYARAAGRMVMRLEEINPERGQKARAWLTERWG